MGTNRQVFGSGSERTNYYKLSRQWGRSYRIYHNLPFLNVFNTKELLNVKKLHSWEALFDPNEPYKVSIGDIDYNRLKKTSIDYTLCDASDKPILCIDFDGISDGFNVGTEYRFDGPPDPWRELITGLKLKVAHGSMFPYFVVGYDHFKDLSDNIQLTMVDGIIGEVLSNLETRQRIGQGFKPEEMGWTQKDFDNLSPDEQHEVIQDWVLDIEVEAEMNNNPISVKVEQLRRDVHLHCKCTWLSFPNADNAQSLDERHRLLNNAISKGCRCTLERVRFEESGEVTYLPCECGPVSASVWLPNFKTPGCTSVLGLVEDLSKLVALEKARKLLEGQGS